MAKALNRKLNNKFSVLVGCEVSLSSYSTTPTNAIKSTIAQIRVFVRCFKGPFVIWGVVQMAENTNHV